MAKSNNTKGRKKTSRRGTAAAHGAAAKSIASRLPVVSSAEAAEAKRTFEQGVISRGEAIESGKRLRSGITHLIVGHDANGKPILKRARVSLF